MGGFEYGGSDVDDVVPLRADFVGCGDVFGPGDDQGIARAAVVGRNLLGPHEGRVAGDGPAGGHVRIGGGAAPLVVVLEHVRHSLLNAVEVGDLVEHAVHAALGAGAVVAEDVEDERVVELAHLFEGVEEAADFVVAVFAEGGVDLHLVGEELFLVRR